jgi:hypothetical protein
MSEGTSPMFFVDLADNVRRRPVYLLFLYFPETGRGIAENGSLPAQGVNRAPLLFVHSSSKVEEGNP